MNQQFGISICLRILIFLKTEMSCENMILTLSASSNYKVLITCNQIGGILLIANIHVWHQVRTTLSSFQE